MDPIRKITEQEINAIPDSDKNQNPLEIMERLSLITRESTPKNPDEILSKVMLRKPSVQFRDVVVATPSHLCKSLNKTKELIKKYRNLTKFKEELLLIEEQIYNDITEKMKEFKFKNLPEFIKTACLNYKEKEEQSKEVLINIKCKSGKNVKLELDLTDSSLDNIKNLIKIISENN